jgi:dTDP-4-amino-4,6-dideoxygalactose transaminase
VIAFLDLAETTAEVRAEVTAAWEELLDSGQFIGGEAVRRFEAEWAEFCGTAHAVGVANGTDALHLALRAMGIGEGDDVVLPANTFVATAEAVVLAGANPRFADVDPDTLLITEQTLKSAVTPATRAVIVVHLYGQMADLTALTRTAAELGIEVIEDAAQAQGSRWGEATAGSVGRVGCFSFYPGKNLGAFGDAGAVTTSDQAIAERIASLRDHGRVEGQHSAHGVVGMNSRLDAGGRRGGRRPPRGRDPGATTRRGPVGAVSPRHRHRDPLSDAVPPDGAVRGVRRRSLAGGRGGGAGGALAAAVPTP